MPLLRCSKHLIAVHCTRFLNRHAPLPSLLESHCCPLINTCSPSSVDKKSILPLPFIATDESLTFGGEKGPMDIVFPGLREPWVAFHLQRALLRQVRRQGPCSIKALPPQPGRTIPDSLSPSGCQRPSALHLPATSAESQRLHTCRAACVLAIPNPPQTCQGLDSLVSFLTGRQGASHATNV